MFEQHPDPSSASQSPDGAEFTPTGNRPASNAKQATPGSVLGQGAGGAEEAVDFLDLGSEFGGGEAPAAPAAPVPQDVAPEPVTPQVSPEAEGEDGQSWLMSTEPAADELHVLSDEEQGEESHQHDSFDVEPEADEYEPRAEADEYEPRAEYDEYDLDEDGEPLHSSWVEEPSPTGKARRVGPKVAAAVVVGMLGMTAFYMVQSSGGGEPAEVTPLSPELNTTPGYETRVVESSTEGIETGRRPVGAGPGGAAAVTEVAALETSEGTSEAPEAAEAINAYGELLDESLASAQSLEPGAEAEVEVAGTESVEIAASEPPPAPIWELTGQTLPPGAGLSEELGSTEVAEAQTELAEATGSEGFEGGETILLGAAEPVGAEVAEAEAGEVVAESTEVAAAETSEVVAESTEVAAAETSEVVAESTEVAGAETGEVVAESTEVAGAETSEVVAESTEVAGAETSEVVAESTEVAGAETSEVVAESSEVAAAETGEVVAESTEVAGAETGEVVAESTEVAAAETGEVVAESTEVVAAETSEVVAESTEVAAAEGSEPVAETAEVAVETTAVAQNEGGESATGTGEAAPGEAVAATGAPQQPVQPAAGSYGPALPAGVVLPSAEELAASTPTGPAGSITRITQMPSAAVIDGKRGPRQPTVAEMKGIWMETSVPMDAIGSTEKVLTPRVGKVRVVLQKNEIWEGTLYAVGKGQIWITSDKFGRMALDGKKVERVLLLDNQGKTPELGGAGAQNLAGLERVRVKTPGGTILGKVIDRNDKKTTLLTEDGGRITLDSSQVEFLTEAPTVALKHIEQEKAAKEAEAARLESAKPDELKKDEGAKDDKGAKDEKPSDVKGSSGTGKP